MIIVTKNTITPWLNRLSKGLRKQAPRRVNRVLKYGQKIAQSGVAEQISQDLYRNISVIPATVRKPGKLVSINKRSITGFPYELWVNRDVTITGRRPFFTDGIRVNYGDGRTKAVWKMTPGYFTIARKSMQKFMDIELKKLGRWIEK